MRKTIIFDLDGVLVDSEPLHIQHLHLFLKNIGVTNPERFQKNIKGVSAHETWKMLQEEFKFKQDVNDLRHECRASYLAYLQSLPELPKIPGAIDFVQYCYRQEYQLALASSASPLRIELFLQKLKLASYFDAIVSGDDVEHSKPAPDSFLLAAKRLGAEPSSCTIIEDAENGVRAAKTAGMTCIAFGGSEHNTDNLHEADLVISDFYTFIGKLQRGEARL